MQIDWPVELFTRTFAASEVAKITGVPADRQRLLASRHIDFRVEPEGEDAKRKVWRWTGVQAVAVFDEIAAHLGPQVAENALRSTGVIEDLDFDLRNHPDGDFLIVLNLDHPHAKIMDGVTNAEGVAKAFGSLNTTYRPRKVYLFNLSDLQRRLAEKIGLTEG